MKIVALDKFILFLDGETEGFKVFEVDDSLIPGKLEGMEVLILEGGAVFGEIDCQKKPEILVEIGFGCDSDKMDVKLILIFHLL